MARKGCKGCNPQESRPMPEPLLLTLDHTAQALSVSTRTVRRLIDSGALAPIRLLQSLC
jgi:hypothetical protein